jgi:hypothetical protein
VAGVGVPTPVDPRGSLREVRLPPCGIDPRPGAPRFNNQNQASGHLCISL